MSELSRTLLWIGMLMTSALASATPLWIEHASKPGPDLPAQGMSRFDQIFLQGQNTYRIPYPFSDLVKYLETGIDNGGRSGVRRVFVPIGRSLQRDAPAPDYFHFPRVVIALEGEPVTQDDDAGEVLEYRLFIAHQPKTESLEIISYNDEAGRFEFQVVENYAAGLSPTVRQANRVMCLSCHQNAAPIFAQKPWTETSFNVAVAKRLVTTQPQRNDSLIGLITEDAGIIDVLSERANYLSAAQYIWRFGCASRRCRAAMLRAILQYRLSGESSFDGDSISYRNDYFAELSANWERQWPQGLALASSRIADRDPFGDEASTPEQDPLSARSAQANWYQADAILARGIIYRLAGFLTRADIQRLDRHLFKLGQGNDFELRRHQAKCKFESGEDSHRILNCGDHAIADTLRARIEFEGGDEIKSLRVLSLQIPGDSNIWQPRIAGFSEVNRQIGIEPDLNDQGLSARLADGARIKSMLVAADGPMGLNGYRLEIEIVDEFSAIDRALEQLFSGSPEPGDGLSADPFRRKAIVNDLIRRLQMPALQWRRTEKPRRAPTPRPVTAGLKNGLALLNPYCGHCHSDDSSNPPGFLAGNALQRVRHCAPRILTRLKAWQSDSEFTRSPMPPAASLGYSGSSDEEWPQSRHYQILVDAIAQLVASDRRNLDYDQLPLCLPPG